MNRFVTCATVLLLLGTAHPSQAASFDCKKAITETEKLICSNQAISELDEQLSIAYKKAVAVAIHKEYVREWQRTWLTSARDHCGDVACLKNTYAEQIGELSEHAEAASTSAVSGKYESGKRDRDFATIIVIELKNKQIRVIGDSAWYVNTGQTNGLTVLVGNKAEYKDPEKDGCSFLITFQKNGLTVEEDENAGCWGLNVSFNGEYQKVRK